MAISISGNSHPHLHHPCPRCGYATRFKQWGIRCLCNRYCSKAELDRPPRRNLADDLPVGHPSRAARTDRPPVCGWEADGSAARLTLPKEASISGVIMCPTISTLCCRWAARRRPSKHR